MGFATETIWKTFQQFQSKKDLWILASVMPLLILIEGVLDYSGLGLLSIPIMIINIIYSLILWFIIYIYLKEDDLVKSFKRIPHYILPLLGLFLLLMGVVLAFAIGSFFLVLIPCFFIFIFPLIFPIVYVSVRLSLILPVLIIEDKGPIDSIKRSWELTKGNVIVIFASTLMLGLLLLVIQVPLLVVQWPDLQDIMSSNEDPNDAYAKLMEEPRYQFFISPISGLINGLNIIASSVLTTIIYLKLLSKGDKTKSVPPAYTHVN